MNTTPQPILSEEERLKQLASTVSGNPSFAVEVKELLTDTKTWASDVLDDRETSYSHDPFPPGTDINKLPEYIKTSWSQVQRHCPDKQNEISYYLNDEERWCVRIWKIANILMTNESVSDNRKSGIYTENWRTYFSKSAILKHAENKWKTVPDSDLWSKVAAFLGWCKQLKDILCISPTHGWFNPLGGQLHFFDYSYRDQQVYLPSPSNPSGRRLYHSSETKCVVNERWKLGIGVYGDYDLANPNFWLCARLLDN